MVTESTTGALLATVTVFDAAEPLTVPSLGVTTRVMTSPRDGFADAGKPVPVQFDVVKVLARLSESVAIAPSATAAFAVDWMSQVQVPRVTRHANVELIELCSGSLSVLDPASESFVFGELGLNEGVEALGGWFAELTISVS